MVALERLLADVRERLGHLAQLAGPWGPLVAAAAALLLVIGRRYHFISWPGILMLLALAAFAFTLRAIHLGRF
jgi:hypothetical protein